MTLTVFTPTYNRAYCLHQVYNSLLSQTCSDFIWLIIDDGSSDNTSELVGSWIIENKMKIVYIYQENQGMHGAHNTAYKNIKTDYNICIDSDDYMPSDTISTIVREIDQIHDLENCAGLVGLDIDKNGLVIGTEIPPQLKWVKLNELYTKYGVRGDKKLVYKTAIVNQYPEYPLFEGERFVPLCYKYLLIDQDYVLKPVNKAFCVVEYLTDGSSKNILKQYKNNPKGFAFSRISRIKYGKTFKEQFKDAIHLVSSTLFLWDFSWLTKTDKPFLVFFAIPFGVLLNLYIRIKNYLV